MKSDVEGKLYPRKHDDIHTDPLCANVNLKNHSSRSGDKIQVVGIINCTPDSFYEGSRHPTLERAVAQGQRLIQEGADWLDVGGESTRPGAQDVALDIELQRVLQVIRELTPHCPISIDTRKSHVAIAALEAGATMINDVSGFIDPRMIEVAAQYQPLCCVVHAQGPPSTMHLNPTYPQGVMTAICHFFEQRLEALLKAGVPHSHILLDPGIGFGKRPEHNWEIIRCLSTFHSFGCPLYLGLSRKSFLQRTGGAASDALAATLACGTVAIQHGIRFLRVHDVAPHRDLITTLERLKA